MHTNIKYYFAALSFRVLAHRSRLPLVARTHLETKQKWQIPFTMLLQVWDKAMYTKSGVMPRLALRYVHIHTYMHASDVGNTMALPASSIKVTPIQFLANYLSCIFPHYFILAESQWTVQQFDFGIHLAKHPRRSYSDRSHFQRVRN